VFSASSESVSVLLRALAECRRLDILSRPQITTMDNQLAYLQVGQRVPRITASNITTTGTINTVTLDNVGIILQLQPRVSPDDIVTMAINAEKSEVGPLEEGIPISINNNGDVIRSPRYDTTAAQTTVSAANGQTIVLGGLLTARKEQFHRRVPYLSNLPVVGNLFRYDGVSQRRTELLIVMTPHVIRSEADADRIKRQEAARMSWCLGDVIKLDGDRGLRRRMDEFGDDETVVVYPETQPTGLDMPTPAVPGAEEIPPPNVTPTLPNGARPPAPEDPTLPQSKRDEKPNTMSLLKR
jgi:general secretion pathway protein D